MENVLLKGAVGRGDITEKLLFFERSLMEEQLLTNDLRKKLQTANKQNSALMFKVRKLELEAGTNKILKTPEMSGDMLQRERSHSLTDLDHRETTSSPTSPSSPGESNSSSVTKVQTNVSGRETTRRQSE